MYYLFYGFLYVVSLLPMRVLYLVSDGIYAIIYYIIGYRRKIVMDNLRQAFPEKSEAERIRIAKKFYHNFIDSFVEVIKLISASETWLHKRFTVDVRALDEVYATGKSCQMHLGHTFNWEWGQIVLTALTKFKILVVYMPISNKVFEKLFYKLRTRSGNAFLPAPTMREAIVPYLPSQYLLGLVADQCPGNMQTSYWIDFLGVLPLLQAVRKRGACRTPAGGLCGYRKAAARSLPCYHKVGLYGCCRAAGRRADAGICAIPGIGDPSPAGYVVGSYRRWKHAWKETYEPMRIDQGSLVI